MRENWRRTNCAEKTLGALQCHQFVCLITICAHEQQLAYKWPNRNYTSYSIVAYVLSFFLLSKVETVIVNIISFSLKETDNKLHI